MKTYSFLIASLLFVGLAKCATAAPEATGSLYDDSPGLSFRFDARQSGDHASRVYSSQIALSGDVLYIYATMSMGPANPIRLVDGHPEWRPEGSTSAAAPPDTDQETALGGFVVQDEKPIAAGRPQFLETVSLGTKKNGKFVPALKVGLGDDRRAEDLLHVTPWVWDGKLDHFAAYARLTRPTTSRSNWI